jgi:hypothetical protein
MNSQAMFSGAFAFVALMALYTVGKLVRRNRLRARDARVRLEGEEVSQVVYADYGSISRSRHHHHEDEQQRRDGYVLGGDARSDIGGVPTVAYYPDQPRWVI